MVGRHDTINLRKGACIVTYWLYILANRRRGAIYVGVTSNLQKRVWQHREGEVPGYTSRYGITQLVYFEPHDDIEQAIAREKRLKRWRRAWKDELIEATNPEWHDLWDEINR